MLKLKYCCIYLGYELLARCKIIAENCRGLIQISSLQLVIVGSVTTCRHIVAARLQAAQLVTGFITSQHAMQAECNIVMAFLPVCMTSAGIVCKRMDISSNFFDALVGASFYFYQVPRCYKIPRVTASVGALNSLGMGKFCKQCPLSWKL